ncbi:phosphopantetheine-binding protein [Actinocorallia longicatena]|uniref:Carrier domain-containing protein n=1 Tax=Actinocorallia longicatena TaxID=111803 RepID=A0ABP6PY22_9ACTN
MVQPCSALEQAVARTVGEVLGLSSVGVDLDFFAAGGGEREAAEVADRLGRGLGAGPLPVRIVTSERTVGRIARHLAGDPEREAVAGVWLFGDGMSEAEREARLRDAGCGHAPR